MSKPISTASPSSYYPGPSSSSSSLTSTSTTNTKSKRHSLGILPPGSPGPRPLHLLDGTSSTSSAGSYAASPISSSTTASLIKASRRQSSISYYPPDRSVDYNSNGNPNAPSARSPLSAHLGLSRSSSVGRRTATGSPAGAMGRNGERMGLPSDQRGEKEKEKEKERPPLTLAEKHAELLHFIAQKESKCLEIRSQLAVHEEELLQLKRKWERIVNRGFEKSQSSPETVPKPSSSNAITSPASAVVAGLTGPAVLEGIKEGMHRFLVAGLSITDPNTIPSSPSLSSASASPLSGQRSSPLLAERSSPLSGAPTTQRWRTHAREEESLSSVSTHATATSGTTRYSQCSSSTAASSLCEELGGDDVEVCGGSGEGQQPHGESDNGGGAGELMVQDTGATPTTSPSPAFKHKPQQDATKPEQPAPNSEPQPQEAEPKEEFDETTFASSLELTPSGGAKVHRRNSRDVARLHWTTGLSAIEPGLLATEPGLTASVTASSAGSSRGPSPLPELESTAKLEGGSGGREKTKTNGNMRTAVNTNLNGHRGHVNGRSVNGMGSLPPPSSIPGLGVLTGGGALWVGSVGKKWGELRDSPAFTKNQKRASVLLSDVSQSFISAWNAPTTPIGSAPPSTTSRTLNAPLSTSPLSPSLLDDDNDDTIRIASVMTPDPKKPPPTASMPSRPLGPLMGSSKPKTTFSNPKPQDEDEEWNW